MKISGNTIFIAGGTAGIGLGMAMRFKDAGNTVIVGGRNQDALARIAAEHSDIATIEIDTTNPDSIAATATELTTRFPDLNVLWRPATSVDSDHTRITGHRRNPDGDEVPEVRRRL